MIKQQWQVAKVVFWLTLKQTFRNKKTIGMVGLACLPVIVVILQRVFSSMGEQRLLRMFPETVVYLYLMFLGMLFALFYASAVIADEIEDRTLTYLLMRPVHKATILLSKYIAYLIGSSAIVLTSLLATFLIIYTHPKAIGQLGSGLQRFPEYALLVFVALVSYGAIYLLFGSRFKRPVLYGLFLFGWEKLVLTLPGVLGKLSVIHYLLSLLPGENVSLSLRPLVERTTPASTAWIVLVCIPICFLLLAVLVMTSREYRFAEQ